MRPVTGCALLIVPTSAPSEVELCVIQGSGAHSEDAERNETLVNRSALALPLWNVMSVMSSV